MKNWIFLPLIALSGLMFDIEFSSKSGATEQQSASPCMQQKARWEAGNLEKLIRSAPGTVRLAQEFDGCEYVEYL